MKKWGIVKKNFLSKFVTYCLLKKKGSMNLTNSRMCLGKKGFVSVKIDGKKQHMEKRLFCCNLRECIILLYFAENLSYIVQDLVQGFHWTNSQATLHPFVLYFKDDQEFLEDLCCCTLFDFLNDDSSVVHTFIY